MEAAASRWQRKVAPFGVTTLMQVSSKGTLSLAGVTALVQAEKVGIPQPLAAACQIVASRWGYQDSP